MFLSVCSFTGICAGNDSSIVFDCHDGSSHIFLRVEEIFVALLLSGVGLVHIPI
jgi:hypothetical protein